MVESDVDAVLDVQEAGAVRALAEIFPQEAYPFPRRDLRERWLREVHDPSVGCYVIQARHEVAGFVAVRDDEILHFGTAVRTWGSGLAGQALAATLTLLSELGFRRAYLYVFEENVRARRFYEKHGWVAGEDRIRGSFPPHPYLVKYARDLPPPAPGQDTGSCH